MQVNLETVILYVNSPAGGRCFNMVCPMNIDLITVPIWKLEAPIIQSRLNSWQAMSPDPKQASTFTLEEIEELSTLPYGNHLAKFGFILIVISHPFT